MKNKLNLFFLILPVLLLINGCSKREPVPEVEISRLEAEHAIARARSEIHDAQEAGADITEPQEILTGAQSHLEADRYGRAKNEAERAGALARDLKQELLARARRKSDAQAAIERARRLIDNAADRGGDVSQPEEILQESKVKFEEENYDLSITLADEAAALAQEIINKLTADTYTVGTWEADRDCLWNIAARDNIYGDPWMWKRIYRANEDKITDPDLIFPGQEFIIPRD